MSQAELAIPTPQAPKSATRSELPSLAGPMPPAKPLSIIGLLRKMQDNPLATIPVIAYEQPVWDIKGPLGHQVFVHDPAGIKRVLLDHVANYPKAELDVRILSTAFGDGLLTSEGEKWRAHRRVMAPAFDIRSIASYAPVIAQEAEQRLDAWDRKEPGAEVNIASEMTTLTREIIARTMFSTDSEALGNRIEDTLHGAMRELSFGLQHMMPVIGPVLMRSKLARIRAHFAPLDDVMQALIQARGKDVRNPPRDLLDRLIAATDTETGFRMSDAEVRDEVIIIFLAGHETSALAATYVWYLLSLHPDVEAKLHAELDRVLGGRLPGFDDLEVLPYTRMVIEESLRLYPPAPMLSGRRALADDEICGVKIPKGTEIAILPWVLHRHKTLWDDPLRFDPERFAPEKSSERPRFAYLPFGGGPHICVGATMAMAEVSLLIAAMAQRYRLKLVPGQDITLLHRITLRPRDGIRMVLERRR